IVDSAAITAIARIPSSSGCPRPRLPRWSIAIDLMRRPLAELRLEFLRVTVSDLRSRNRAQARRSPGPIGVAVRPRRASGSSARALPAGARQARSENAARVRPARQEPRGAGREDRERPLRPESTGAGAGASDRHSMARVTLLAPGSAADAVREG